MRTIVTQRTYPLLIVLLLGAFLLFSGWAAYRSIARGSSVLDADYYAKGLRYSDTRAEEKTATDLGWQLESILNQRKLSLRLSDRQQRPVANAVGTGVRLSPSSGSSPLPLQEAPAGTYHLVLPAEWHGETLVSLDFTRDGARFSRRLLLHLDP